MARDSKGITQFYLHVTHSRTIPAFTPQPQGITTLCLVHIARIYPRRDGQAELTWMTGYTEMDFPAPGVEPRTRSPIPVLTELGVD